MGKVNIENLAKNARILVRFIFFTQATDRAQISKQTQKTDISRPVKTSRYAA